MTGRPRKPTKLHKLQGTYRADRNPPEPEPEQIVPDPPEHLGEIALAEWHRLAEELDTLGLLTRPDRAAFAAYCEAYEEWVKASKIIQREGLLMETTNGNVIQHPAVGIRHKAWEVLKRFLTEFGLSPASRAKVPGKPKPKKSELEKFRDKKGKAA